MQASHQRAVLPPRTDLGSRHKRVAAQVMVRGLDLYERLKSRLLVEVPFDGSVRFLSERFGSPITMPTRAHEGLGNTRDG